jgi:hypothetical protein
MSTKVTFALFLLLAGPSGVPAHAQCETATLAPGNPTSSGYFGIWCDVDGDTAVISARGDLAVPLRGAVHVYTRNGTSWVERQELAASDGQAGDFFGTTVSISGDRLAVGSFAGKAYVFVRTARGWLEEQILQVPGLGANEHFGSGVWLDGDTLVVSAQREGVPAADAGAAYVFVRGVMGVWWLQQRLQPGDAAGGDISGFTVLAGDTLLMAAPGKDARKGAIYRFTRSGTRWTQQEKLTASDGQPGDLFGGRLSIDGNTLLVTAALPSVGSAEDTSAVYVFERSGASFVERQRIDLWAPGLLSWIFSKPAIHGDTFVISAPWETGSGPRTGAAYVFTRSSGTWTQTAKLVPSRTAAPLGFGLGVAVTGGAILIGSPGDDRAGLDTGCVHVFELPGAAVTYHDGRGINLDTLTTTPASAGQTWTATLGVAGPHTAGTAYLAIHRACRAGTPVLGGRAEFLLDGDQLALLGPVPHAGQGSTVTFTLSIPASAALVGKPWAAQGILLGGPSGLTNAAAGIVR